ncbi:Rubrerythrin [Desulfofarcimen acetoxidans DSM 771]|uniref:Rubrerythrin n=1 Tax=Desulfofarcimen acetoxidans (strain ATCC 49208 / DSM 771 / KCTC 5769 / VKM B-1644 / 5575) TaxID=485916 RepID=C8VW70_DESAS|nr:ferritin family protein [Desulfofarcimen acetoxidans]ACV62422.1 Rubrerythrin [Desulfofarcimen acetoxidans DSM 771]
MGCQCGCQNNATHKAERPSVETIIDMAVRIEKAGQKFYSTLAIYEYNEKIKDLLIFLAGEEAKHVKVFENLSNILKNDLLDADSYSNDYLDYLNCIARTHLLFNIDIEDADFKVDTARETLELALKFERDSITVFQEMLEVVGKNGKEVLKKLIEQEREHVLKLAHSFDMV